MGALAWLHWLARFHRANILNNTMKSAFTNIFYYRASFSDKININFNWGSHFMCFQFSSWLKKEQVKHLSFRKQMASSLKETPLALFWKEGKIGWSWCCFNILIFSTKMTKWKGQLWISSQNNGKSRLSFTQYDLGLGNRWPSIRN